MSRDCLDRASINAASLLRGIFEHASDAMVVAAADGTIAMVNRETDRLFGYRRQELLGCPFDDLIANRHRRDHADHLRDAIVSSSVSPKGSAFRLDVLRKDGTEFVAELTLHRLETHDALFVVSTIRDCGDRAANYGFRAGKMESLGRLAAGIGHEFNNVLTVINGSTQLALANPCLDEATRELLTETMNAGARAARLTRLFLAFARQQHLQPRPVDLNTFMANLESKLHRLVGEGISLNASPAPVPVPVICDPAHIEQVVENLVINACDAMMSGGQITIAVRRITISDLAEMSNELEPGCYGAISVADTGHGIPEDVKAHIFEPFFTTRPIGNRTGLGLAAVYGIVKQSGGFTRVESDLDRGATFTVYLPIANDFGRDDWHRLGACPRIGDD